jgi:DNA-directed RNA polymerase subunit RPC12/RpoP
MSERIICQGCGQRITVPDDYRRNKIQCPECGVITPVDIAGRKPQPSSANRRDNDPPSLDIKAAPSQAPTVAARTIPEPEPDIASLPDAAPSRPRQEPEPEPTVWTCSHCGEWQPRQPRGKKARCPVCKTPVAGAAKARSEAVSPQLLKTRAPRQAVSQSDWSEDPEDSKPYKVDALEHPGCPACGKPMEPQAILCLHCGHDLRRGVKARTTYDVIVRRWDAGLALHLRWLCFAAWQCVAIPPMLWGAGHEGHAFYVVGSWLWLSVMAAFLAGTFDRIDLERNARGKVRLVKTWYFCFVPRPSAPIDLVQYDSIVTGQMHELDFSDYIVLVAGIGFGLIPGIAWYFAMMQRNTWFVALTKDHGHPELWIYRGWSESRAQEIATTLRTAVLPEYSWY